MMAAGFAVPVRMQQPDWSRLVLDPAWLERLEQRASRRFPDPATAEEAVTWVLERLSADDWARCRRYSGRAQPTTWLYSLSANLLEEFSRARFGRVRPPQWLVDQGTLWLELWQQLCLDRRPVPHVIDTLSREGEREPDLLMNIVRTIKARLPWCGASHLPIPLEHQGAEGESFSLLDTLAGHAAPEQALAGESLEAILATVAALLDEDPAAAAQLPADGPRLRTLRERLRLDDEELLLLRMRFRDGLSFSAIARALGVPIHRPGRQMKLILERMHAAMTEAGIVIEPDLHEDPLRSHV